MKKKHLVIPYLLALVGAIFLLGPSILHLGYRALTSVEEREHKKKTYFELANAELQITNPENLHESQRKRSIIYYWFHSRGWILDEGGEEPRFAESWRKLFHYWNEGS